MMPQRFNPASVIALMCVIPLMFLLPATVTSLLIILIIFIALCLFLMWKFPRLRYWYKSPKGEEVKYL